MIKYLVTRRCPKCFCDFVIVLLDRSSSVRSINGFCGNCDHRINWRLIRKKARSVGVKASQEKVRYNRMRL
jgi:hypothetical protein